MLERRRDPFQRNAEQAQRSARAQIDLVMANLDFLRKVDRGGKLEKAIQDFSERAQTDEQFSPNALSFIDGIYEKMLKGAGYESVNVHSDRKSRGLRYG